MGSRTVACLFLLAAGCTDPGLERDEPEPELILDLTATPATVPVTGWEGLAISPPQVREWAWVDSGWGDPGEWVPVEHTVPWDPGMASLVLADGAELPLVPRIRDNVTLLGVAEGWVPPGSYTLRVRAQGFEVDLPGLRVDPHGQDPAFDSTTLNGVVYPVTFEPHGADQLVLGFAPQLYLRAIPRFDGTADVSVWAEGERVPLCRAWRGDVELSEQGFAEAGADELTTGGDAAIRFTDVSLLMGFLADGAEVAGIDLAATVDTRQLDFLLFEEGEPVVEGEMCLVLARLGATCGQCEDSDADLCTTFETWGGHGEGMSEAAVLARAGARLDNIDDAPPCGGPEGGSFAVCSTLGTAGVGAWVFGLGVLLLRRRRATATP